MASVSSRARSVKQPRGGYIKPSQFKVIHIEDGKVLNEEENVAGSIIGMAVDYLTRFSLGSSAEDAFSISLMGASIAQNVYGVTGTVDTANKFLHGITGIDDKSVINACKLAAFDVWLRDPYAATLAKGCSEINPDKQTIHNIQVLVQRCISVFSEYGPVIKYEVTFEPEKDDDDYETNYTYYGMGTYGGYTGTVNSGDGDYLTKDTLWDVKVLKSKLTSKHTLQLLMYWIMGQHSGQKAFKNVTKIGIFNPRLNKIYLLDVDDIPADVIQAVEDEVICY